MKDDAPAAACQPPTVDSIDDGLLVRIRRGDRLAMEDLVRRHHPAVSRLVRRLVGYSSDSDDLVQEVFVRAVAGVRRFDGGSTVSTWLTRIAINVCRTHHRRRFFRASFWVGWRASRGEGPSGHPHDRSDAAERDERVRRAVAELPVRYRQVVVLHYLEGKSVDEVAELIGVSKNAAEVRLHRGRKMLEEALRDLVKDG